MKYLGKRYLKNWIKEYFNIKENNEYGKYHGDEWLKGDNIDLFCIQGKKINISIYEYNEEKEKNEETERRAYYLEGEEWVLRYQRIGKDIKIYK